MEPKEYKVVYNKEEIAARVRAMGAVISTWAHGSRQQTGQDPVVVPLLRGALVFSADLIRCVEGSVEVAPIATEAYDVSRNEPLEQSLVGHFDKKLFEGRAVLLVDDVCDSGRTLEMVVKQLREANTVEVRSAVIVNRVTTSPRFVPDWIGFNFEGPEWFVGYGMDDSGRYRNMADICVIERNGSSGQ